MPIYELNLKNLGLFDDIHFEFDPRINVFVGPNNCGKSTVQMALADIAVYPFSTPARLLRNKKAEFTVRKGRNLTNEMSFKGELPIIYEVDSKKYKSWNKGLKEVGYSCFIPALRWSTGYRAESVIPEKIQRLKIRIKERGEEKPVELRKRLSLVTAQSEEKSKESFESEGVLLIRDQAVIQSIIELDYKAYRQNNPAIRKVVEKIAAIASEITCGFPIEFVGIGEDERGLYPEFKTPDGKMPINVLSQGTQSVIQWLGLMLIGYAEYYNFPQNLEKKQGVVIIDEIDAHMHPSWQRRILPAISYHFPKLQFFCSSHSPFVLAGLKAGQVQLLKRDRKGKVIVSRNENDIVGWSTDEISRNFLDIANPTDSYTNDNIERLQKLRRKKSLSKKEKNELKNLRNTVNQNLITGAISSEMNQLVQIMQKASSRSQPHKKSKVLKKKKKSKIRKRTKKS